MESLRPLFHDKMVNHEVDWSRLSQNSATPAMYFLRNNPHLINWYRLSYNTSLLAIEMLEANPDKINWHNLSSNPSALSLLNANVNNIVLPELLGNSNIYNNNALMRNAIFYINSLYQKHIWLKYLSANTHSKSIAVLEANLDKVDWGELSANPAAIHILEANLDKVDWYYLSANPAAIHILEANLDKVDWELLSLNPAAIELLEGSPENIDWSSIWANPAIFVQGSYM